MTVAPGRWALKGGFALETRLGGRARVSVDLDADHLNGAEAARADLQRAAITEVGDHFGFAVIGTEELRSAGVGLAVPYKLESSLAGRPYEPLQVDVSTAAPDPWDVQAARRPGILTDLGLDPIEVWLIPLERQVAEKLHAYTRTYESGGTTRARDLVDLMLIREHERLDRVVLRDAIQRVFDRRATHGIPKRPPLSACLRFAPSWRSRRDWFTDPFGVGVRLSLHSASLGGYAAPTIRSMSGTRICRWNLVSTSTRSPTPPILPWRLPCQVRDMTRGLRDRFAAVRILCERVHHPRLAIRSVRAAPRSRRSRPSGPA